MFLVPGNRLPIQDPEYRYPSSHNPYWSQLQKLAGSVFSDNKTEAHAGQWRTLFSDFSLQKKNRELHVEIGCNAGHVIVEWAAKRPECAYIGIDWKFKPIFRAVEKTKKRNLANLLFFRAHAERIEFMFGSQEVDFLYLFFPDPWPRKSQWKNRFLTYERLQKIAKIMKPTGVFHIKTDHASYYDWILKAVHESSETWKILEVTSHLHKDHPAPETLNIPEVTLFEKLFIRDQLPIHSLKLQLLT